MFWGLVPVIPQGLPHGFQLPGEKGREFAAVHCNGLHVINHGRPLMYHDVPIRSYRICNVWLGDAEIENQQTPKTSHHCQNFC